MDDDFFFVIDIVEARMRKMYGSNEYVSENSVWFLSIDGDIKEFQRHTRIGMIIFLGYLINCDFVISEKIISC